MIKLLAFRFVLGPFAYLLSPLPYVVKATIFDCFSGLPTFVGLSIRYIFLKSMCESVGHNVYIGRWTVVKNCKQLRLGSNVSIHEYCYIDAIGGVTIGSNVSIAHSCSILSFEHTWNNTKNPIKYNELHYDPVRISDDVWLGAGVRVLSGVSIRNRVIVGAGSVVKGELLSNHVYGGVPCKILKVI